MGDKYWNGACNFTWMWLGKTPTAIVPEWDMQPLTKERLVEDTNQLKTWIHPQTITIRAIEAKQAEEKTGGFKFKPMVFIVIGIVILAAYWIFFGGSG